MVELFEKKGVQHEDAELVRIKFTSGASGNCLMYLGHQYAQQVQGRIRGLDDD